MFRVERVEHISSFWCLCHLLNRLPLSGPNVGPLELSDPHIEACASSFKFKLCPDLDGHDVISLVVMIGVVCLRSKHGLKLTTTLLEMSVLLPDAEGIHICIGLECCEVTELDCGYHTKENPLGQSIAQAWQRVDYQTAVIGHHVNDSEVLIDSP